MFGAEGRQWLEGSIYAKIVGHHLWFGAQWKDAGKRWHILQSAALSRWMESKSSASSYLIGSLLRVCHRHERKVSNSVTIGVNGNLSSNSCPTAETIKATFEVRQTKNLNDWLVWIHLVRSKMPSSLNMAYINVS